MWGILNYHVAMLGLDSDLTRYYYGSLLIQDSCCSATHLSKNSLEAAGQHLLIAHCFTAMVHVKSTVDLYWGPQHCFEDALAVRNNGPGMLWLLQHGQT